MIVRSFIDGENNAYENSTMRRYLVEDISIIGS